MLIHRVIACDSVLVAVHAANGVQRSNIRLGLAIILAFSRFPFSSILQKELNMTALQGWIVIGLLVLIMLGIVGLGAEIQALPYLWRTSAETIR